MWNKISNVAALWVIDVCEVCISYIFFIHFCTEQNHLESVHLLE